MVTNRLSSMENPFVIPTRKDGKPKHWTAHVFRYFKKPGATRYEYTVYTWYSLRPGEVKAEKYERWHRVKTYTISFDTLATWYVLGRVKWVVQQPEINRLTSPPTSMLPWYRRKRAKMQRIQRRNPNFYMALENPVPKWVQEEEAAKGRRFQMSRHQLHSAGISMRRWGSIRKGGEVTLPELATIANMMGRKIELIEQK